MLKEEPDEAFIHYAICLELAKISQEEATRSFRQLMLDFPDYLPACYQYSFLLAETGQSAEALEISEYGIKLAERLHDLHALAELKNLRQNILAGEFD